MATASCMDGAWAWRGLWDPCFPPHARRTRMRKCACGVAGWGRSCRALLSDSLTSVDRQKDGLMDEWLFLCPTGDNYRRVWRAHSAIHLLNKLREKAAVKPPEEDHPAPILPLTPPFFPATVPCALGHPESSSLSRALSHPPLPVLPVTTPTSRWEIWAQVFIQEPQILAQFMSA